MRKMNTSLNMKIKYLTEVFMSVRSSSMKDYTCHHGVSTLMLNGYLNFNKNNENLEIIC